MASPELESLKELYELMLKKGLDAIEVKDDETRVKLTRRFAAPQPLSGIVHHVAPAAGAKPAEAAAAVEVPDAKTIVTPLAGVFYRASSPTSVSFVKEGDLVDVGQTLCIVEAMKVMNEIKAEASCKIVKIVAENGRPVTAGQILFHFEPA
jgi:acetyl-CoA carboxylase biotin carboxyl carrier protein